MSMKRWVVSDVGQYTSSTSTFVALPSPISWRRGFAPKLPPLLTQVYTFRFSFANGAANSRANGRPIRRCADKFYGEPIIGETRILEEGIHIGVAQIRAAQFDKHILVAIVIEVGEDDSVALL